MPVIPPTPAPSAAAPVPVSDAAPSQEAVKVAGQTAVVTKKERKSVDGRASNSAAMKKRRTTLSGAPAAASSGAGTSRSRSSSAARKAPLPTVARGKSPAPKAAAPSPAAATEKVSARGRSRTKSDAGANLAAHQRANVRYSVKTSRASIQLLTAPLCCTVCVLFTVYRNANQPVANRLRPHPPARPHAVRAVRLLLRPVPA